MKRIAGLWRTVRGRADGYKVAASRTADYSFRHAMFIGGLAAIAYGAWMAWHPLGPIIGGWFAVKVAFVASQSEGRGRA